MSVTGISAEIRALKQKEATKGLSPTEQEELKKLEAQQKEITKELFPSGRKPETEKGLKVEKNQKEPTAERSQADKPRINLEEFEERLKASNGGKTFKEIEEKEKNQEQENRLPFSEQEYQRAMPKAREACKDHKAPNGLPDSACIDKALLPILKENRNTKAPGFNEIEYKKALKEAEEDCKILPNPEQNANCIDQLTPFLLNEKEIEKAKPKFGLGVPNQPPKTQLSPQDAELKAIDDAMKAEAKKNKPKFE